MSVRLRFISNPPNPRPPAKPFQDGRLSACRFWTSTDVLITAVEHAIGLFGIPRELQPMRALVGVALDQRRASVSLADKLLLISRLHATVSGQRCNLCLRC